jgi:hypothetical protein
MTTKGKLGSAGQLERRGLPSGDEYEARQQAIEKHDRIEERRLDLRTRPLPDPGLGAFILERCERCGNLGATGTSYLVRCLACGGEWEPRQTILTPSAVDLNEAIYRWNADNGRAVSCLNCANCVVARSPSVEPTVDPSVTNPLARCRIYTPGFQAPLFLLLRYGVTFRAARECPFFCSMTDEDE